MKRLVFLLFSLSFCWIFGQDSKKSCTIYSCYPQFFKDNALGVDYVQMKAGAWLNGFFKYNATRKASQEGIKLNTDLNNLTYTKQPTIILRAFRYRNKIRRKETGFDVLKQSNGYRFNDKTYRIYCEKRTVRPGSLAEIFEPVNCSDYLTIEPSAIGKPNQGAAAPLEPFSPLNMNE